MSAAESDGEGHEARWAEGRDSIAGAILPTADAPPHVDDLLTGSIHKMLGANLPLQNNFALYLLG